MRLSRLQSSSSHLVKCRRVKIAFCQTYHRKECQPTVLGTGNVSAVYARAMPRLPPAPLKPKKRSGSLAAVMFLRTALRSDLHFKRHHCQDCYG